MAENPGWRSSQIEQPPKMPVSSPVGAGSPRRKPPQTGPPAAAPPSPHQRTPEGTSNVNFERGGSRDSGGGSGLRPLQSAGGSGFGSAGSGLRPLPSAGGSGFASKQMKQQQKVGPPPAGAPPGISLNTVYTAPVEEKKPRKVFGSSRNLVGVPSFDPMIR